MPKPNPPPTCPQKKRRPIPTIEIVKKPYPIIPIATIPFAIIPTAIYPLASIPALKTGKSLEVKSSPHYLMYKKMIRPSTTKAMIPRNKMQAELQSLGSLTGSS